MLLMWNVYTLIEGCAIIDIRTFYLTKDMLPFRQFIVVHQCDILKAEANLTVTKDTQAITTSHMQASKGETVTLTATVAGCNAPITVGKVVFKVKNTKRL